MFVSLGLGYAFVLTLIAGCTVLVSSAPLPRRQTSSAAQCNLDLLKAIVDLQEANDSVSQLAASLANTTASADVVVARSSIQSAQNAIGQLATAVFANQTLNATLTQEEVRGNITLAANALSGIVNGTSVSTNIIVGSDNTTSLVPPGTLVNSTTPLNATDFNSTAILDPTSLNSTDISAGGPVNTTALLSYAAPINFPTLTAANLTQDVNTTLTNALELLGAAGVASASLVGDCGST